ncbi:hypothetical protein [Burkholderia gladioli]|uniref:hypothetical protein n=1 Tax=Burkholderia gladioli TaxID=28095 RepID=UPI00163ECD48|nr:hypothetical protein [Burkholderia gladioli]
MDATKTGKPPAEWNVDVLYGLHFVLDALMKSMIQTHPDCERLLDQFDVRLGEAIEAAKRSGRTKLEEAAVTDYGATIREMILRRADRQAGTSE